VVGGENGAYNLGNVQGNLVKVVVQVAEKVSGKTVPVKYGPRRAGDPPRLVADASKIRQGWGWSPKYGDLEESLSSQ
jgi:UDP-glucose 4-epimerase